MVTPLVRSGLCLIALLALPLLASERSASTLAQEIHQVALNPNDCFRVRDLHIVRDDLKIYLNDGYLVFSTPVAGARVSALFTADVEGGDAELLVMPPFRGERRSLARFVETPTLNRHFKTAVFVFSDGSGEALAEKLRSEGRQALDRGPALASMYSAAVRNIAENFELRLVQDLLNPDRANRGVFFATITDTQIGNYDLIYDPSIREQVTVGQFASRLDRPVFDYWTNFESQSVRLGHKPRPGRLQALEDFRMEATLEPSLNLKVVTKAKLRTFEPGLRALGFEIADRMEIEKVTVDGQPAEVHRRESLRGGAIRTSANGFFLVILPEAIRSPGVHEIEFQHSGQVILNAGKGIYYVASRNSWYPNSGADFTTFDLTFRYPKNLDLVATGEVVSETTEGDWKTTRRKTSSPIRFAGFNLGEYQSVRLTRGPYTVDVFGNRELEPALQPSINNAVTLPQIGPRANRTRTIITPPPPPDTAGRLQILAGEVAAALEFMAGLFGPPPLKTLTASPIPAGIGQGFPGLLYISTMSYLKPGDLPAGLRSSGITTFYTDILAVHEVAHQWWGNSVTSPGYQEDWLQEALANYSALLYLERKKGAKALDDLLDLYREHLVAKDEDGMPVDSAGPISLGTRLRSSKSQNAWRIITYEKGSWILHMLRKQMGDAAFLKFLGEAARRFQRKDLSNEDFRKLASEFMPKGAPDPKLELFFENWVYGTGIPALSLQHSVKRAGARFQVSGTLAQSQVAADFEADVPVEIQFARGPAQIRWVHTTKDPENFEFTVAQRPVRIVVGNGVLQAEK